MLMSVNFLPFDNRKTHYEHGSSFGKGFFLFAAEAGSPGTAKTSGDEVLLAGQDEPAPLQAESPVVFGTVW